MNQIPSISEPVRCNVESAKIVSQIEDSIAVSEQECHFNIDREANIVHICCSHTKFLTKLQKNPDVVVRHVVVNRAGRILQILGEMPVNRISLRGCGVVK